MKEIIEYEYKQFLEDVQKDDFGYCTYLDTDEYEDDYSHCEICEAQMVLASKIFYYLKQNRPDEFILHDTYDILVGVESKQHAMKRRKYDEEDLDLVKADDEWWY